MVLCFGKGIVAERGRVGNSVFGAGEIEDIGIAGKTPMGQAGDIKTEIPSVLVAQA